MKLPYDQRTEWAKLHIFNLNDNFKNISQKDNSDSQRLDEQLSFLSNFIKISANVIIIKIKWDDLWVEFINQMLQPIEGMTFEIHLEFNNSPWKKFAKAFEKAFTLLYKYRSYIWELKFNKEDIEDWKYLEDAIELTDILSQFEIGRIKVENWIVDNSWFRSLLQIEWQNMLWFKHWVFWYKKYKKLPKFDWKYNKKTHVWSLKALSQRK